MKTGIELISEERQEQIEKHGRTIESDVEINDGVVPSQHPTGIIYQPQLSFAASLLCIADDDLARQDTDLFRPYNWNVEHWSKMMNKPYKDRLIIAGALIAAEIDRLQSINQN